jgi:hypothetical protein
MEFHFCTHLKEWFCNSWYHICRWHVYNENACSITI